MTSPSIDKIKERVKWDEKAFQSELDRLTATSKDWNLHSLCEHFTRWQYRQLWHIITSLLELIEEQQECIRGYSATQLRKEGLTGNKAYVCLANVQVKLEEIAGESE